MNTEQIKTALHELIKLYQTMEREYDLNLTSEVMNVNAVLYDIDEARRKAECREAY